MGKNRVLVLYYHRVNVSEMDYNLLCVSPIRFRQQMLYLKNNYQIVRFEDDWNSLDTDAVAVTFDDGYLDNLTYAVPVLEELEVPADLLIGKYCRINVFIKSCPRHFMVDFRYRRDGATSECIPVVK